MSVSQESTFSGRVLFVDDEQGVLDGYERLLRKEFYVSVALGAQQGLKAIHEHGPFAVVVSDMRMPGMNGAEFLAQVRREAPDTVRMLLTGYTDLSAAIAAVNEGNIFRFLTKPSTKEALLDAINAGIFQHRSTSADTELIKKFRASERSSSDRDGPESCNWDNFEGPTGLGGPSQARAYLTSLIGVDPQCYVVLFKFTTLGAIEQRYGEEMAVDYLNIAANLLMGAVRSEDRLFHWGRDVLMAIVRRPVAPSAVRMELTRFTSAHREYVMNVSGKNVMIASPITFNLLPASDFSTLEELLGAFDPNLTGMNLCRPKGL